MEIIYLLIPLSLLLVGAALWAFFWAVKNGQFDDLDSPALDVLDDELPVSGVGTNKDKQSGADRETTI